MTAYDCDRSVLSSGIRASDASKWWSHHMGVPETNPTWTDTVQPENASSSTGHATGAYSMFVTAGCIFPK